MKLLVSSSGSLNFFQKQNIQVCFSLFEEIGKRLAGDIDDLSVVSVEIDASTHGSLVVICTGSELGLDLISNALRELR